jgi:hypothetical protein
MKAIRCFISAEQAALRLRLQKSTVVSFFARFATVVACPSFLITLLFITRFFFSFLALRLFWKCPNRPCIILCAKAATSRNLRRPRSSSRSRRKHGVRSLEPQSLLLLTFSGLQFLLATYTYVRSLAYRFLTNLLHRMLLGMLPWPFW